MHHIEFVSPAVVALPSTVNAVARVERRAAV
jgi:hypothetical protein